MGQHRELVPVSVYLPEPAKLEAERRAREKAMAPATLMRLILLGHEQPLLPPEGS